MSTSRIPKDPSLASDAATPRDDALATDVGWSRRSILTAGLLAMAALGVRQLGVRPLPAAALPADPPGLDSWVGGGLQYRVSCPAVADFAVGELRLQRIRNSSKYLAVLETSLKGVVGLLTMQRSDLFASVMEWSRDLGRFLPVWHGDQVARRGAWRRKVQVFHRDREEYTEHKLSPEWAREARCRTQGRLLDDPLTAFFNWRVGAFGPLRSGQGYEIDNLARKDPLVLRFQVVTEDEARRERAESPDPPQRAFLLRAHLERELQESVRGYVEAWLDKDWVPLEGRATQVRWVGEVTAYLAGRTRLSDPELTEAPSPPLRMERWSL